MKRVVAAVTALAFYLSLAAPYVTYAQEADDSEDQGVYGTRATTRSVRAERPSDSPDDEGGEDVVETDNPSAPTDDRDEGEEGNESEEGEAGEDDDKPASNGNQTEALPSGPGKSAVTPQAISLPKGEGSIEGMGESFTPNLSAGTGTFSVPISLPAGRAGVQPSLALSYSTSGGNGPVGVGWSVAAPFISRQTDRGLPKYLEASDGLWHAEEDTFMYNGGQELVPVDNAAATRIDGAPVPAELQGWQQYRSRVEGAFMRFFRSPDHDRWVVQDKGGTRFEFGLIDDGPAEVIGDAESSLLVEDDVASGRVFQWSLTRMSDVHGSAVYYTYLAHRGQRYLDSIYYVSPNSCAGLPVDPARQRGCSAPLSEYARRVKLVYESRDDVLDSYITTWNVTTALRLKRIEVTGYDHEEQSRTLVRRYHLRYDATSYLSLLQEVQVEGRPDAEHPTLLVDVGDRSVSESALGDAVIGRLLPPMVFTYSQPLANTDAIEGFGGVDGTVYTSPHSPSHSVDDARADLFDVNSDGLPDLIVTDPARYQTADGQAAVGVFFNGFSGSDATPSVPGEFSDPVAMPMPTGDGAILQLNNLNVVPMDIDGDGRSDLLHMPRVASYGYYTPARRTSSAGTTWGEGVSSHDSVSPKDQTWTFAKVAVANDPAFTDPRIDFGRDGEFTQVVDVNNDHLIDVVRTTGTSMQTWLNLGWVPGGDGRFGQAHHNGAEWVMSPEPIESCVLQGALPVDFGDSENRLADMNGDGLQDIVQLRRGRVQYWPGRGVGAWGVGPAECLNGGADRQVEMETPPQELSPELDSVFVNDVNGDGASDIVQVRSQAIDVYFNRAGHSFTARTIITNSPFAPSFAPRVRFADVDGSGTTDILFATADNYRWIDPMGGQRARLLIGVENGLGGLTSLEYDTSINDYLRDLDDAHSCQDSTCERFTWNASRGQCDQKVQDAGGGCVYRGGGSPVVSTVVRAVTTSDQMSQLGATGVGDFVKRTEYAYHDGYYEGIEQEFRGFGAADAIEIGDSAHPTGVTRTYFYQGRRPNDLASDRTRDNPLEALKGRTYRTEVKDLNDIYLSSEHASFTLRRLLTGLNGIDVSYAFVNRTDTVLYDTASFVPSPDAVLMWTPESGTPTAQVPTLVYESADRSLTSVNAEGFESRTLPLRSSTRYAHTLSLVDRVDNVGNTREQTAFGRVRGEFNEPLPDEHITSHSVPVRLPDTTGWLWRTLSSWTTGHGAGAQELGRTTNSYNAVGDLLTSIQTVTIGAGAPAFTFPGDANGAQALTQTADNVIASTAYDGWGNVRTSCGGADLVSDGVNACLRFGEVFYDDEYRQFPILERIGATRHATGFNKLSTTAQWDRGLGVLISATDPNAVETRVSYDGLGRMTSMTPPSVTGCTTSMPIVRMQYEISPQGLPISVIHSFAEQSCERVGANQKRSRSYVDGLGRSRASVVQAESETGATGVPTRWQRGGITTFTSRGAVLRSYQPDYQDISAGPAALVSLPNDIPSTLAHYDAFSRPMLSYAEDNSRTYVAYHALSTDLADANDLSDHSVFSGTVTTERKDGHGRVIDQVLRNRRSTGGSTFFYRLWTDYRADGQVIALTRAETFNAAPRAFAEVLATSDAVDSSIAIPRRSSRSFYYDSAGRRLGSTDPDADDPTNANPASRGWRYRYNRIGDLIGVRDPRGCGQNFYYDHAGRLIAEDYVTCTEAQQSAEVSSEPLPNYAIGTDVLAAPAIDVDVLYYFDAYPTWFSLTGITDFPTSSIAEQKLLGRATAVLDRGQRSTMAYDDRGNVVWSGRQMAVIANPRKLASTTISGEAPALETLDVIEPGVRPDVTYDPQWYTHLAWFDHASRPLTAWLPLDPALPANPRIGGALEYNARGLPSSVSMMLSGSLTLVPIVKRMDYTRDGLVRRVVYGDTLNNTRAATESVNEYDIRRRPFRSTTYRAPTAVPSANKHLAEVDRVFDQIMDWDEVNNLLAVFDERDAGQWPAGFRPQTYEMAHDALYRVENVDFTYSNTTLGTITDSFVDWRSELALTKNNDPMRTTPAPSIAAAAPTARVAKLTYKYDWLANMTEWKGDTDTTSNAQFYERTLGNITNGFEGRARPSALYLASNIGTSLPSSNSTAIRGGYVEVGYGAGGNVTSLTARAQCRDKEQVAVNPALRCYDNTAQALTNRASSLQTRCTCSGEQHFQYRWDELNRLSEARRYDRTGTGNWTLAARQRYRYDGANQRTVKQTLDATFTTDTDVDSGLDVDATKERLALYVYGGTYERRGIARANTIPQAYIANPDGSSETQFVVGGARVVQKADVVTGVLHPNDRVTIGISNLIQTTSAVIDLVSGALVETSTYYPNGARETYRAPDTENVGAEPMGFTGKEADEEIGLTYFGERYLIARIGRWASPDPLSIHEAGGGEALNAYHYVSGNLVQARDPLGLDSYCGTPAGQVCVMHGRPSSPSADYAAFGRLTGSRTTEDINARVPANRAAGLQGAIVGGQPASVTPDQVTRSQALLRQQTYDRMATTTLIAGGFSFGLVMGTISRLSVLEAGTGATWGLGQHLPSVAFGMWGSILSQTASGKAELSTFSAENWINMGVSGFAAGLGNALSGSLQAELETWSVVSQVDEAAAAMTASINMSFASWALEYSASSIAGTTPPTLELAPVLAGGLLDGAVSAGAEGRFSQEDQQGFHHLRLSGTNEFVLSPPSSLTDALDFGSASVGDLGMPAVYPANASSDD